MGTRNVVMKDGFIQQVDSPTELYLHPVNTFVAGFIGMPPMNFIPAKLAVSGNEVKVSFYDFTLTLPEKYSTAAVKAFDGKEVILGVRSEAITDEESFVKANSQCSFKAHVDVVEMLGAETYLYVTVGDMSITCRVDPTEKHSHVGDLATFAIDGKRVHLFDKETQRTITN